MTNLGIVIGVSEYSAPTANLPACSSDGRAVANILQADSRFEDTLVIDSDTKSGNVKRRLIEFINRHKGKAIGDVVFYFTGHGDFSGDEFYYLLSDFDPKRKKQTSLENSELDNLIRLLNPNLFVKIVDACHSGISYIKNSEDFESYLTKSAKTQFQKLYFMFSSQSDQFSYQDSAFSFFTRRLIDAIAQHDTSSIRYKDIIDFISDIFEGNSTQTPFFVTQADFTEIFSDKVSDIKQAISQFAKSESGASPPVETGSKAPSIADLVIEDAKSYCTQDEALERINQLPRLFERIHASSDLALLYDFGTSIQKDDAPRSSLIGQWLAQNKDSTGYFFSIKREVKPVTMRVPKDPLHRYTTAFLRPLGDDEYKVVTEQREYIVGYSSTVLLPYSHIRISAEPKYPNIKAAAAFVAPLLSMTHMRLFWAFTLYDNVDWKDRKRVGKLEWAAEDIALKDNDLMATLAKSIAVKFFEFIEAPLKARWGKPEDANSYQTASLAQIEQA